MKIGLTCPECGTECFGRVYKDDYGVKGSPAWDEFEQESGCDCEKSERFFERAAELLALELECRKYGL